MWFLGTFGIDNGQFAMVDQDESFLAIIGNLLAWIFVPCGFGNWQAVAASLSGLVAKEGVVSTLGVITGLGEIEEYATAMHDTFAVLFPSNIAAISFLLFNLYDSPCLAALSTLAREIGGKKKFWTAVVFQNILAYVISLIVYQLGGLITGDVAFNFWTVVAIALAAGVIYLLFKKDPNKKEA